MSDPSALADGQKGLVYLWRLSLSEQGACPGGSNSWAPTHAGAKRCLPNRPFISRAPVPISPRTKRTLGHSRGRLEGEHPFPFPRCPALDLAPASTRYPPEPSRQRHETARARDPPKGVVSAIQSAPFHGSGPRERLSKAGTNECAANDRQLENWVARMLLAWLRRTGRRVKREPACPVGARALSRSASQRTRTGRSDQAAGAIDLPRPSRWIPW